LSDSNCQETEEEEIAENYNSPTASYTGRALIDEIGKFNICDYTAFANGSPIRHHHDDRFSSSDGWMDDYSAKVARIPLPWEILQLILKIL
jgi:hypothetical protein